MKWFLALIITFTILWRLPLITGSFWLDEAAQALESARPFSQQLQIKDDFQPPLLHLLVHFEMIFSKSEWWLRLGAAFVPGVLTILVTYKIGEKLVGKNVGLLASVLLASSSFHVFYSQELRPYSLPAFFASLSWLLLIQLIQQTKKIEVKVVIFFFLVTTAGLYTSYLYPFLLLSQLIYIWFFVKRLRQSILGSSVSACVTFLPWLPSFLGQLQAGQSLRKDLPGWQEVVSFNQFKSIALIFGKFTYGILDLQLNAFFICTTLILILGLSLCIFQLFKQKRHTSFQSLFILFCWLVIPVGTAWLVSFIVPVLQPKRLLYCLPAFYLFLSCLIFQVKMPSYRFLQKLPHLLAVLVISINIFSSFSYFTQPKYQREDWRSMHAEILNKYPGPRAIAIFAFPAPFAPWQWYDDGKYPTFATGVLTTAEEPSMQNAKVLTEYRFVLVFDYLRDLTDPQNKVLSQLREYGFHEVDQINPSTPLGFVRVYAKSQDVIGSIIN